MPEPMPPEELAAVRKSLVGVKGPWIATIFRLLAEVERLQAEVEALQGRPNETRANVVLPYDLED